MFGLPLYLRNTTPAHQSSVAQMAQHTECAIKCKRKGRETERENGGKMGDQIAKKKKKKNKEKKKYLHAHTFSNRDPCAMTFRECKILAVLDCKELHTYFLFQVSYFNQLLMLDSRG